MVSYDPIWFPMICMVPYAPVWFSYGPICSPLVPYGTLQFSMVYFGPLWCCMVLFGPVWFPYGPLRSCLFKYGYVLSRMDPYGRVWSIMIVSSPIALLSPVRYKILTNIESFVFLLLL